jgi:hypothetical protein
MSYSEFCMFAIPPTSHIPDGRVSIEGENNGRNGMARLDYHRRDFRLVGKHRHGDERFPGPADGRHRRDHRRVYRWLPV